LIEEVTAHAQRDSLEDAREICADGTYFPNNLRMNKEMYIDNLRRLRDEVSRKCLEKWRTNIWFLLHDNAPAHRSLWSRISEQRTT